MLSHMRTVLASRTCEKLHPAPFFVHVTTRLRLCFELYASDWESEAVKMFAGRFFSKFPGVPVPSRAWRARLTGSSQPWDTIPPFFSGFGAGSGKTLSSIFKSPRSSDQSQWWPRNRRPNSSTYRHPLLARPSGLPHSSLSPPTRLGWI